VSTLTTTCSPGRGTWHSPATSLIVSCSSLNVAGNRLNGSIPQSLSLCTSLTSLSLAQNFLSGSLPAEALSTLTALVSLNVSGNSLNETLPSTFTRMQQLRVLDAARNNFSGAVPSFLSSLGSLQHLNLQGNRLSGVAPEALTQLGPLTLLTLLDLSENDITGTMPTILGQLDQLKYLNLSGLNFSGKCHLSLTAWSSWRCSSSAAGLSQAVFHRAWQCCRSCQSCRSPPAALPCPALRHAQHCQGGCFLPAVLCLLFLVPHLWQPGSGEQPAPVSGRQWSPRDVDRRDVVRVNGSPRDPNQYQQQHHRDCDHAGWKRHWATPECEQPLPAGLIALCAGALHDRVLWALCPLSSATSLPYETSTSPATNSRVLFPVS